jgi:hypothetical protein
LCEILELFDGYYERWPRAFETACGSLKLLLDGIAIMVKD